MGNRPTQEFYRDAGSRSLLVMRVCTYLRVGEECNGCPEWEDFRDWVPDGEVAPENSGCKRMCRAMAEELIAVVHQAVSRGPEEVAQDNDLPSVPEESLEVSGE